MNEQVCKATSTTTRFVAGARTLAVAAVAAAMMIPMTGAGGIGTAV